MTAYKESGIKWLGKIPTHWEIKPLKYLGFLYSGLSGKKGKDFSKDKIQDFKPYIPFINICKNHYLDNELLHYVKIEENETQNKVLKYDLFFMTSSETKEEIGKNAIYLGDEKELYLNSFCRGFRFTSNEINPLFINYLLSSKTYRYYFSSSSNGDIRINLKKEIIENLLVLLPPLEEQEKIADFLDKKLEKIDYFIAKQTKFIELLKEKKQVLINQATTKGLNKSTELKDTYISHLGKIPTHWEVVRLKNIAKFNRGLNITKENLKDDGVYCISYGEIHSKYPFIVNPKNHKLKCVENEYLNTNINSMLYKGDFIFADTSEDIEGSGNFTLYDGEDEAFAGYHTIIVRVDKNIFYPKFLAYEFDSKTYRNKIQSLVSGVKVFSITQAILRETEVWIPPLEEQEKIAKYLDDKCEKIDKAINNITKQISLIQEYKTSLIDTTTKGMLKELK